MNIMIFGTGKYFEDKKDKIEEKFNIIAFVDNFKEGTYHDKDIIKPQELEIYEYDYIIIMSSYFFEILDQLKLLGINKEKIILGQNILPYTRFEEGFISSQNKLIINNKYKIAYLYTTYEIEINTIDELNNIREIYAETTYNYNIGSKKNEDIVIDIGMNIGGATIYFATKDNVQCVYGFEPFEETFFQAEKNCARNSILYNKIKLFNLGIGIEDLDVEIPYNSKMTCGMSTIEEVNTFAIKEYDKMGLIDATKTQKKIVKVRDCKNIIEEIIENNKGKNYILKLDCEGAEYDIIEKLSECCVLNKFKIIMLEWHYKGSKNLEKILVQNNFNFFSFKKSEQMGLIYAINTK